MNKIKYCFLFLVLILFNVVIVNAECDSMSIEADNVSFTFSKVTEMQKIGIDLSVLNINNGIYAVISNDFNDEVLNITSKEKTLNFSTPTIYNKINYTLKIYSKCDNSLVKTIELETPSYNKYSSYNVCDDAYDIELCEIFYDTSDLTSSEFIKLVEEEKLDKNRTFLEKVWDFVNEYYLYIFLPIVLVSLYFVIQIFIQRRREKNAQK